MTVFKYEKEVTLSPQKSKNKELNTEKSILKINPTTPEVYFFIFNVITEYEKSRYYLCDFFLAKSFINKKKKEKAKIVKHRIFSSYFERTVSADR